MEYGMGQWNIKGTVEYNGIWNGAVEYGIRQWNKKGDMKGADWYEDTS